MSEFLPIKCKRILILANLDVGLYRFRKELINTLIDAGCEVYISLPDGDYIGELTSMGCKFIETPVDRRGINPVTDLKLLFNYSSIIKRIKPELVITYTIKPNIYGAAVCRIHKTPYAVNITGLGSAIEGGGTLQKLIFAMYRFSLKKAQTVFFENKNNRDILVKAGVVPYGRDLVMPGAGVNTDDFRALPYLKSESVNFLFVGRLMREKGMDELLYAAKELKKKYAQKVQFDFVGFYEDEYKNEVERLSNEGVIKFHGFKKDVRPFYENAGCVVLPSWHEGMSNVILEAAACARPVITNDIPGCREAVEDGKSGFLCIARDKNSLLKKMEMFIMMSSAERENMGLQARKIAQEKFDKMTVVKKTLERLL